MRVSRKEPGLIVSAARASLLLRRSSFSSPAKFRMGSHPGQMMTTRPSRFRERSEEDGEGSPADPERADKVAEDRTEADAAARTGEGRAAAAAEPQAPSIPEDDEPKARAAEDGGAAAGVAEETKPAPLPPERPRAAKADRKTTGRTERRRGRDEAAAASDSSRSPEARRRPKPAPTPPGMIRSTRMRSADARQGQDGGQARRASKSGKGGTIGRRRSSAPATFRNSSTTTKPQTTGSTGREVVRTAASLGTATGTAARMSPNMMDALNSLMIENTRCWHYFGTSAGQIHSAGQGVVPAGWFARGRAGSRQSDPDPAFDQSGEAPR